MCRDLIMTLIVVVLIILFVWVNQPQRSPFAVFSDVQKPNFCAEMPNTL